VRDGTAECSPEPFDAIGFRIVGGGVDQHQLPAQFLQQRPRRVPSGRTKMSTRCVISALSRLANAPCGLRPGRKP
jgi:hypothetical protein